VADANEPRGRSCRDCGRLSGGNGDLSVIALPHASTCNGPDDLRLCIGFRLCALFVDSERWFDFSPMAIAHFGSSASCFLPALVITHLVWRFCNWTFVRPGVMAALGQPRFPDRSVVPRTLCRSVPGRISRSFRCPNAPANTLASAGITKHPGNA